MKKAAEYIACGVSVLLFFLICSGCEQSDAGPALGVSPSSVVLDVATGSVELSVGSGTTDGSLPLEWSVDNPSIGRIIRSEGMIATYARLAGNGQNRITVRDQHGVEGIAIITQVDDASVTNETDTVTDPIVSIPSSAFPAGDKIIFNNFWNDGDAFTTPTITARASSFQLNVSDSAGRPGESHLLTVTGITWSDGTIIGFTAVVDGGTPLTYP